MQVIIPKIEGEKKGLLKSLYFQYTKKEKKLQCPLEKQFLIYATRIQRNSDREKKVRRAVIVSF